MPNDGKIHFYFDFLSPFGYFGSLRVNELAMRHKIDCEWHPILLGISVLKVMGLPPIAELPLKGAYIRKDAERYARRHQLKLKRPFGSPQINPLLPARMVAWLKTRNHSKSHKLASKLYSAHWSENLDISDKEIALQVAEETDLNIQDLGSQTHTRHIQLGFLHLQQTSQSSLHHGPCHVQIRSVTEPC